MFDMHDDLLVEDTLLENEIDPEVELEAAMEIVDIQLEAETEDDEDLEECGGSCKSKKGCTESDDDLDDDGDEIEEALGLMDYEY